MVPTIKIMISSTRKDLAQYRQTASEVIRTLDKTKQESLRIIATSMEEESQIGERETPVEVSKRWVEESEWIVLIVGWWYGFIPEKDNPNGLSVTECEYRYATELQEKQLNKRKIFVFLAGDEGDTVEYCKSAEETKDLGGYHRQDQAWNKLKEFRKSLSDFKHIEFFKNLTRHSRNQSVECTIVADGQ